MQCTPAQQTTDRKRTERFFNAKPSDSITRTPRGICATEKFSTKTPKIRRVQQRLR
jgi:hypothetical protein